MGKDSKFGFACDLLGCWLWATRSAIGLCVRCAGKGWPRREFLPAHAGSKSSCSTCERIDKVAVTVDPIMRGVRERELADIAQTLHFLEPPRVPLTEYDFRWKMLSWTLSVDPSHSYLADVLATGASFPAAGRQKRPNASADLVIDMNGLWFRYNR